MIRAQRAQASSISSGLRRADDAVDMAEHDVFRQMVRRYVITVG
jgi:hypothetical protein